VSDSSGFLPPLVRSLSPPMDTHNGENGKTAVANDVSAGETKGSPSSIAAPVHGAPEVVDLPNGGDAWRSAEVTASEIDESKKGWFAYLQTRDFYLVLLLGYELFREPL